RTDAAREIVAGDLARMQRSGRLLELAVGSRVRHRPLKIQRNAHVRPGDILGDRSEKTPGAVACDDAAVTDLAHQIERGIEPILCRLEKSMGAGRAQLRGFEI